MLRLWVCFLVVLLSSVFLALYFSTDRMTPQLVDLSKMEGRINAAKKSAEAMRLLADAAEQNPTAGRSVSGGGALSDLVRPQPVSVKDWEKSLQAALTLKSPETDHVAQWRQMTGSSFAVYNYLSYGRTYPFYMPPVETNRLVVVDMYLPLQPEQGPDDLYRTGEVLDGSELPPEDIGHFQIPGIGDTLFVESWPKDEQKCALPGCPLVVFTFGGQGAPKVDPAAVRLPFTRSPNCKTKWGPLSMLDDPVDGICTLLDNPLGRWAAIKKQRDDLGVVFLGVQLPSGRRWAEETNFADMLIEPLVHQVLSRGRRGMMADPDRVHITGLSEGGFGVLKTAFRLPHIFTLCIAFALGPNDQWMNHSFLPATSKKKRLREVIIVQGGDDMIRVEESNYRAPRNILMFSKFLNDNIDTKITYRVWPGQAHYVWFRGYVGVRNFLWLGCPLPWENQTEWSRSSDECLGKISNERKIRAVVMLCIFTALAVISILREYFRGRPMFATQSLVQPLSLPNTNVGERHLDINVPLNPHSPPAQRDDWDGLTFGFKEGTPPLPEVDVLQLIQQQACRTPFSAAVETENGHSWTYQELLARVFALVDRLPKDTCGTLGHGAVNCRCGMLSKGGAEGLLGLLAILQAGMCVVPLDPRLPDARLAFLIEDSEMQVAIVGALSCGVEHAYSLGVKSAVEVADIASAQWKKQGVQWMRSKRPRHTGGAYLNYTSGTTGKPKGLISMHRATLSHQLAAAGVLRPHPSDVSLFHSPPTVGFHMCQLFPFLQIGAKLVLPLPDLLPTPSRIWEGPPGKANVTFSAFVPSVLDPQIGGAGLGLPRTLRLLKFSGEALGGVTVLRTLAVHKDVHIVNWWGNTECLGCTAVHMDPSAARWISEGGKGLPLTTGRCAPLSQALPLGMTIRWRTLHVLPTECDGRVLATDEGEACVTGPAVAPPYLNRPKEAANFFVDSKFGPGNCMRTGDLLMHMDVPAEHQEYSLRYVGRKDFQVKVNGVRIELGEIEEVAMKFGGIDMCVVKLHALQMGDQVVKQLVAYIVGKTVPATELQSFMAKQLPKAMVPHQVVQLKEFPRNQVDKIDRNALAPPALNLNEAGFAAMDSLGLQRFMASRDEVWAHFATQAMYSLVPFCLLYSHWCPFNLHDVTAATDSHTLDFLGFVHHIRILNVTALFMGLSDKTSRKSYSPIKSFIVVAALYLLMGWPRMIPGDASNFATLHRWTFVAIMMFKIFLLIFEPLTFPVPSAVVRPIMSLWGLKCRGSVGRVPVAPVLVVLLACITPLFGSVSLKMYKPSGAATIWPNRDTDTGIHNAKCGDVASAVIETSYYGSPNGTVGSWMVLGVNYFAGYYLGMAFFCKQREIMMALRRKGRLQVICIRITAALAAVGLAWMRELADVPVKVESERRPDNMTTWDWPNYFDGFYPMRFFAEWLFALLLTTALCDGAWAWNLVGRNLLFTYLGHMIIIVDVPALLDAVAPAGAFLQMVVILLLPYVYSLSIGSILFELLVQCSRFVRQRPMCGKMAAAFVALVWFVAIVTAWIVRIALDCRE